MVGPLLRRLWWLVARLLLLLPVAFWVSVGGPYLAVLVWGVLGYVGFRAAPAVREDLRRVAGLLSGVLPRGRYSSRGLL